MSRNILICLEKLEIGGIETAVVNQAISLKKKGNNVYVLAQKDLYTEVLKKENIICIDYEFDYKDIGPEKIKKIVNLIEEKNIDQVHIHKISCYQTVIPACIIKNVPYITFLHLGLSDEYDWLINSCYFNEEELKKIFENSQKIICITENVKKYNQERFNINDEKYLLLNNSIDFDIFKSNKNIKYPIKRFILISRFSKEKIKSIENGIELFKKYVDKNKGEDLELNIVGDGKYLEEFRDRYKINNKYNINFNGATNDIKTCIENSDVVIGMGRCLLEAIAMKRLAIVSGYEKIQDIINKENIKDSQKENFSGRAMKTRNVEKIIDYISDCKDNNLNEIIESNYKFIKEKLDINKNVYFIKENIKVDYNNLYNEFILKTAYYKNELIREKQKSNEIWESKIWLEEQYSEQKKYINKIEQKMDEIRNKKIYKIYKKIFK